MAAICLVLGIGLTSSWLQLQANEAAVRVNHDQEVLRILGEILLSEVDAETGQRGYLITGDPAYLAPYQLGVKTVEARLGQLQSVLPQTPENHHRLAKIQALSATKLAELAQTITLRQTQGFEAAKAVVDSDLGRKTLDKIRAIIAQWSQTHRRRLRQEQSAARDRASLANVFLILSGLSTIALMLWSYVRILRDLHLRRSLSARLAHEASHDALTQLPNRRFLYEWMEYALAQARRDGRQVALLFLDLDGFKPINDQFGHKQGDLLLQAVAKRLKQTARAGDFVARLGGDEFAVLIPSMANPEDPAGLATRLLESLALPFQEAENRPLGASIGIAFYPTDADTQEALLAASDTAMYRAKSSGGHRYAFFNETQD